MTSWFIGGILLPAEFLNSEFFGVLSAFVAINTLIFLTLAFGKILPRIHYSDIRRKLKGDRRRASRALVDEYLTPGNPDGGASR